MRRLITLAVILLWCHVPGIFAQNCDDGSTPIAQTLDLSTLSSIDLENDPDNDRALVCGFAANGNIVGSTYSGVDIQTNGISWCREVSIKVGNYVFLPAFGENTTGPCANNYSGGGFALFQQEGVVFTADNSGCVTVEIFEEYEDEPNAMDADITAGSMTIYGCPQASMLPIELRHFSAEAAGEVNLIRWITESEINSAWHILERSSNGLTDWSQVGKLQAAGTTTKAQDYQLADSEPLPLSYYRLREISFDGSEQFSHVIAVERPSGDFAIGYISPNPANELVKIAFKAGEAGELTLSIFDAFGKRVHTKKVSAEKGFNSIEISVNEFPVGNYHFVLSNSVEQVAGQFFKK